MIRLYMRDWIGRTCCVALLAFTVAASGWAASPAKTRAPGRALPTKSGGKVSMSGADATEFAHYLKNVTRADPDQKDTLMAATCAEYPVCSRVCPKAIAFVGRPDADSAQKVRLLKLECGDGAKFLGKATGRKAKRLLREYVNGLVRSCSAEVTAALPESERGDFLSTLSALGLDKPSQCPPGGDPLQEDEACLLTVEAMASKMASRPQYSCDLVATNNGEASTMLRVGYNKDEYKCNLVRKEEEWHVVKCTAQQ